MDGRSTHTERLVTTASPMEAVRRALAALRETESTRRAADEHLRAATALADDFTLEVIERVGRPSSPVEQLLQTQDDPHHTTAGRVSRHFGDLTARESDVLRAMAGGQTNAQIARSLFVSEGT
ncbi:DNA-binding response regulator, partial [Lacticaseibacillus rhamnosus]